MVTFKEITDAYFLNPDNTEMTQLIVAFSFGVILSPFSYGIAFLLVYLIVYELIYAYFTGLKAPYWSLFFRIVILAAAIFGWIIGRTLVGWDNPFRSSPN